MYRSGHYGAALLVYAPVGAALLAAGEPELATVTGGMVLLLTPVPDYDLRIPFLAHRGVTHTFAFALLVGAVVGASGWCAAAGLADRWLCAGLGLLVGTLAVVAHVLADALTPAGVRPLWPLSGKTYTLALTRASDPRANRALLALGVFVTTAVGLSPEL